VAPSLPPLAVQAAAQLSQLALFDFAALSLLLAGPYPPGGRNRPRIDDRYHG
jgi:hypothetical protein